MAHPDDLRRISDESQLWELIRSEHKPALAELYKRYVDLLYNYGARICKDSEIIEDAIHDVFVDIWTYRKSISPAHKVKYYLYLSLRRRIFKNESKHASVIKDGVDWEEVKDLIHPPTESDIIGNEISDERTRRIKKYLNNLSPRQYEAIVLRFYDEFSYEEIASIMNLNPQSARNLIQRGLIHLRQYSKLLTS